jgi:hypothetical protein
VWWKDKCRGRKERAKIKRLDPEIDIDYGTRKKIVRDYSECSEWDSWDEWITFHREIAPDMTVLDEWEQYLMWQKSIMRK